MEFVWILCAFVCGLVMKSINMPPLIGFLIAGFLLNYLGFEPTSTLDTLANLGITLMLFGIGLKLHVKDLLKREVWLGTLAHMGVWSILFAGLALLLGVIGLSYFGGFDMKTAALVGFALSFSSTVCIIKLLEDAGELKTRHGQIALGILVMQDIAAVVFLVLATGQVPSLWAIALFALLPARPIINRLVDKVGHGEMLPLAGIFLALGAYELFYLVDVKGDLGALVAGILLASHSKAAELNKSLMNFKDLFLIAFFLSIGFSALPNTEMVLMALLLSVALVLKFALFFWLFTLLKLRGRTAFLSALALSNYSEFGLIVAALSVSSGWLQQEWLVILALAVSFSFVITSLLYRKAHSLYLRYKDRLKRLESPQILAEDTFVQPPQSEILVIGLGRVGRGAFDALHQTIGHAVAGMDADHNRINRLRQEGANVFFGDGEDADLWEKFNTHGIKLVLLALPTIDDSMNITRQLRKSGFQGQIAAIARYQDERETLLNCGIDSVFNFYTEAGTGFAEESLQLIGHRG